MTTIDTQAMQAAHIIMRRLDPDHSSQDIRLVDRADFPCLRLTKFTFASQRFGTVHVEAKDRRFLGSPNRFIVSVADDRPWLVRYYRTVHLAN